ncbi:MAG: hypothetical protein JWM93_1086 [Frankiales bacterium]|nr:hypothetical protein [Frankiales bacterium]
MNDSSDHDTDVQALVRLVSPADPYSRGARAEQDIDDLITRTIARNTARSGFWRRRSLPFGIALVVVAATGAAVVPGMISSNDKELESRLLAVAPDVPLPVGRSWQDYAREAAESGQAGARLGNVSESTTAQTQWVMAFNAHCWWLESWSDAYNKHDEAAESAAATVLRQAVDWRPLVADDGAGTREARQRIADAVTHGNATMVGDYVASNCLPSSPAPSPTAAAQ